MIGCDIVKIDRFSKLVQDEKFLDKYFTTNEKNYIFSKVNPAQTLAGIFAAKEAVLKALKIGIGGGVNLSDIEILHENSGSPYALIGNDKFEVSISHDGDYAMAVCLHKRN